MKVWPEDDLDMPEPRACRLVAAICAVVALGWLVTLIAAGWVR